MNHLPHVAARLFNTPLMIQASKLETIISALGGRFGVSSTDDFDMKVASAISPNEKSVGYIVENEVAIIGVQGTLVHKSGYVSAMSGCTGYDSIRHQFSNALTDPKVRAICCDLESPGGEVSGCFPLAQMIYDARGTKPVMAILSDMACSAAYAVASACDVITIPPTGIIGSVGVVVAHADYSQKLEDEGIKITMIHYGDRKVDGSEAFPLSNPALAKIQKDVDTIGKMFVATVARNRGMTAKAVRDTQAGTFLGREGVEIGFADEVLAPEHAFEALVNSIK